MKISAGAPPELTDLIMGELHVTETRWSRSPG